MHTFILDLFLAESFQRAGGVLCAEDEAVQRTRWENCQWSIRLQGVCSNTIWNIAHCNCTHVHTYAFLTQWRIHTSIVTKLLFILIVLDFTGHKIFLTDDNMRIMPLCHQQFSHKKSVQPSQ